MWRGGLGAAYPWPALSSAGASLAEPCSVSRSRSSNRTGGFTASGSRRRLTVSPTESWRSAVQAGPDQTPRATGHPDTARLRDLAVCVWRTATGGAADGCVDPPLGRLCCRDRGKSSWPIQLSRCRGKYESLSQFHLFAADSQRGQAEPGAIIVYAFVIFGPT